MTTTAQAFTSFVAIISASPAQTTDISARRRKTEEYLGAAFPSNGDLPVKRVILIGSANRGTVIRPVDDVDVMAEFINKDNVFETYRYRSGEFLQRIRRGLNAATSIQTIGARGQAVRLFYRSGAHVDIAPVFKWNGPGYALPSGSGGWITTDPEGQTTWFSRRVSEVGANLRSIAKLAKRWNAVHSDRFESYHLEVMMASMFKTVGANLRDAMTCFFEWAPNWLDVSDPAGHSGMLSSYLTYERRQDVYSRLNSALTRAKNAQSYEQQGNHVEAKRLWRIELGEEFPLG